MHNGVVVLHDYVATDAPADQQDTLVQAAAVAAALQALGYETQQMPIDPNLPATENLLRELAPVAVFNLVESINGTGGLAHIAPAWVAALGIPCTGASAAAVLMTTDKLITKRSLATAGVPCPGNHGGVTTADEHVLWIVKPCTEDASIGLDAASVVPGSRVAARIAESSHCYGGEWFAERYIDGREFNLSLLQMPDGVQALPAAEISFIDFPQGSPRIVDYAAKWEPDSFAYRNTVRIFPDLAVEPELLQSLKTMALQCWDIFQLSGYARVDFRTDSSGLPWVLEVNANPCLAPDAGFAAAVEQAGLSYEQAIAAIMGAAGVAPANA